MMNLDNNMVSPTSIPVDDVDKAIIDHMLSNPNVRIKEIAALIRISDRALKSRIDKLKKAGIVSGEGNNRSGSWKVEK
ncbi:MAG: winged helix-turn-helix domain-containing protein [Candidatus Methanomethylophilaceae archaeon]|nr:winged helix-turn-helix domain-containing protein [Candidatus Methanomethylophilaceae archaeon]